MSGHRPRRFIQLLTLFVLVIGGIVTSGTTSQAGHITGISVSALPVFPSFDENAFDYAMRCAAGDNAVDVVVDAPGVDAITVDGTPVASGVSTPVVVRADDTIVVAVTDGGDTAEYWYRCLPADFPTYTVDKPGGTPGPGYYFVSFGFCASTCPTSGGNYLALLDTNGVPVWYKATRRPALDQKLLEDGNIAFFEQGSRPNAFVVSALDGSLVDMKRTVGVTTDVHEYLELANGNTMLMSYPTESGYDLTSIGLTDDETAIHGYLQEIDADGELVWQWISKFHIAPRENLLRSTDLVHLNSIDEFPNGDILISGRSVGVYKIDYATKQIEWKLGGTPRAESLTILNDPAPTPPTPDGPIRQHDARVLPNGNILMFDNRQPGEIARAVEYQIDETLGTAEVVWEYEHVDDIFSGFMGSARRQPDGNTVINWGGQAPMVEEVDAAGNRLFVVNGWYEPPPSPKGEQQYRAVKYPLSTFDLATLRATAGGMFETDAPADVEAVAGARSATVSWTAPTAGQPITGYTVTADPGGLTCTTVDETSCRVDGLTEGEEYTFMVQADNIWGSSFESFDSNSIIAGPPSVPSAPTDLSGVAGDGAVTLSWTAPFDGGAPPITAYTATADPGDATCSTTDTLSCTVTGLTNGTEYSFTVTATNAIGTGPASAPSAPLTPKSAEPEVVPVDPVRTVDPARLLDTRPNGTTIDNQYTDTGKLQAGTTTTIQIAGRGNIPDNATGVELNLTAIQNQGRGYATLYPCTTTIPTTSTLNYTPNINIANSTLVPLNTNGEVCIYTSSTADYALDVVAYIPATSDTTTVDPARLLDTRPNGTTIDNQYTDTGKLQAGTTTTIQIAGRGNIPDNATGVELNLTAIQNQGRGYATLYPCTTTIPTTSTLNYTPNINIANSTLVPLNTNGEVCIYTSSTADYALDVVAYIPATSDTTTVDPARLLDTRPNGTTIDNQYTDTGKLQAGTTTTIQIAGRGNIPDNATGVELNLTAIQNQGRGYATLYPCTTTIPTTSTLNYTPNINIANSTLVPLNTNGEVCIYTSATADYALDVVAYIPATSDTADEV